MKKVITLLERAKGDYDAANHFYNNGIDEVHLDIAAYHCQQCVEKLIKYRALEKGKELNQHHHLSALLRELGDEHYAEILGEIVYDMASWSSAVRYSQHAVADKGTVSEALEICAMLLKEHQTPPSERHDSIVKAISWTDSR